jgi:Spy/CpxP family protein refolding chaperone
MSSTFKNAVAAAGAAVMLSGAAMFGTTATAAATPVVSLAPAIHASVQPANPPHWCPRGKHWRARWFDNHGWWDGHHRWQRGRWNNDGCY